MEIWKILTKVWPWSRPDDNSCRTALGSRNLDQSGLSESGRVESFPLTRPPAQDQRICVEMMQTSQLAHQISRNQNAFVHLSVVAVDYLLEREWFWLARGGLRREGPSGNQSDPAVESNRTITNTDRQWSAIAPID